ncbi:uncharacterized protein ccdc141 isoform X2 [Parambassis ranga]|uniref:Uncharacterized protein ccdc141 isoform X2 n=1 Tax=Parambassis ranga TaxID=210632 RepID=A0A6P7KJB0_9TELE|nr:coiled-coil domain-containing protein 141 isoform X2 [Parambassis ranga]
MTIGEDTETRGHQQKAGNRVLGGKEGQTQLCPSFSTLSTIAIQAGQSQMVLSVLKSGSLVHLQLVQVHPGLCEVGLNQEENHTLIQELQQLLEKLKKHEFEVLSVVEKKRVRTDGGKEEEEVSKAMKASLTEGWLLLLHLLNRRQEVLMLAAQFHRQALEFSVSMDRLEDLQISRGDHRLTEVHVLYGSMRRDLLEKSLQVLSSSSILLQKLKQLQRTEALQRRGGVLQEQQQQQEEEESCWCSRGMVLKLEELVEALQDRRRRVDQTIRLQLQKAWSTEEECGWVGCETSPPTVQRAQIHQDLSLTVDEILESGSTSPDLHPETGTNKQKSGSGSEETVELRSELRLDVQPWSGLDLKPVSESDETKTHLSGLDRSESSFKITKNLKLGSPLDLKTDSPLDHIQSESRSGTKEVQLGSALEVQPDSRSSSDVHPTSASDLKHESRLERRKYLQPCLRLDLEPDSRPKETRDSHCGSRSSSDVQPGSLSESEVKFECGTETRSLQARSRLDKNKDLQPGSRSGETTMQPPRLDQPWSKSDLNQIRNLPSISRPETKKTSTKEAQLQSALDLQPGSGSDVEVIISEKTRILKSIPGLEEAKDLQLGSNTDVQPVSGCDMKPESRSAMMFSSRLDVALASGSNLKPESSSDETTSLQPESKLGETRMVHSEPTAKLEKNNSQQPDSRLDLDPDSRSEETKGVQSCSRSDLKPRSSSNMQPGPGSDVTANSTSEKTRCLHSESKDLVAVQQGCGSDTKLESRPEKESDFQSGSRTEETTILLSECGSQFRKDLQTHFKLDLEPCSRSTGAIDQSSARSGQSPRSSSDLQSGSEVKPESKPETRNLESASVSEETEALKLAPKSDKPRKLQPEYITEQTRILHTSTALRSGSGSEKSTGLTPGSEKTKQLELQSRIDMQPESGSDITCEPRSVQTLVPKAPSASTSDLNSESGSEETKSLQPASKADETRMVHSESRPETKQMPDKAALEGQPQTTRLHRSKNLQPWSRSDLKPDTRGDENKDFQPGPRVVLTPRSVSEVKAGSQSDISDLKLESRPEQNRELRSGSRAEDEASSPPEGARQLRAAASGQAAELQSMLGKDSQSVEDPAPCTTLTNQKQSLLMSFEHLMEKLCSWLQWSSSLLCDSSEAGRQLFEVEDILKTHLQLHTQAEAAAQDAENLQQVLDQLRTLQNVSCRPGPSRQLSPLRALTEQLRRTGAAQAAPPAAPPALLSPELTARADRVLKELQSLNGKIESNLRLLQPYICFLRTAEQVEAEMEELRETYRRRPQEEEAGGKDLSRSPVKKEVEACWQDTLQRLLHAQQQGNHYVNTVTMVLGSGLNMHLMVSVVQQKVEQLHQTKQEVDKLRNQLEQQQESCRKYEARLLKTQQDLKCVSELLDFCTRVDLGSELQTSRLLQHFSQAGPHFTQLDAEVEYLLKSREDGPKEERQTEDLSELLRLQQTVKQKIQQSKSILNMSSSFHSSARQLEALLHSEPTPPSTGGSRVGLSPELQIQNLLETTSALKTDICTAVTHSGWAGFQVGQLEARLLSLDSLRVSWLKEAAQREEKLCRERLTRLLHDDITQLRDSFKELKKRFGNLRFNYLKRNDKTRNMKAVRNQLQQVELYEEKLQVLRQRVQGVMAQLGSEVGGVAREMEDITNELQRQMGELERSVREHRKTLDMTFRLQQAMEEYQFWCEEAGATIARVGKFSLECRSTEAVSVLYRQFEKFVWPTVPQQEERIHQITELAVRVHGVEEGRRCIERTVGKHSEMVESIKELSDSLMELEAKLKLESLKENKEEEEVEEVDKTETEEEDKVMKEQKDNRSSHEAADMSELKETGHTPELTTEHDGKEVSVKRQTAANRKPPLQRSQSQEADRAAVSRRHSESVSTSFCSTHTFSPSCSPGEANRHVHTICSQIQPAGSEHQATLPPSVIGPSFSDTQREFQGKEEGQRAGSTACESHPTSPQDASAGRQSEAEHQQEVMTDDSLSNDEYECASPDDISLPPLAETPESNMIPSDVEDGFCFSSHSIHISQNNHQYQSLPEPARASTGTGRQQKESSQSESRPTHPPRCSSTSILMLQETSAANFLQSADGFQACSGSDPVQKSKAPDSSSNMGHHVPDQDMPPSQTSKDRVSTPQSSSSITTTSTVHHPSLPVDTHLPQGKVLPQSDPGSVLHADSTLSQVKGVCQSSAVCLQTSLTLLQDSSLSQPYPDSRPGFDRDSPSSQTRKEVSSSSTTQNSSLTTTSPVTQPTVRCQLLPSGSHCSVPQTSSTLKSDPENGGDLPELHAPVHPEPHCVSAHSCAISSKTLSREQSYRAVCTFNKSLTSTCVQECVHDPGMTPISPASAAPLHPEVQNQALAQQANPHVTPPSSPPHLLTPDQDPDICVPMAIREEIKLTPQIQGPAIPAPTPQAESLPQEKASRPGPPCFTRPLSGATVMGGSPVTLEVEVTGHPEPTLIWFKDEEVSARSSGPALPCRDGGHFLCVPKPPDSEGSGDRWLVGEVLDIISVETWFGTLCVLLWLLYLILL